MVILHNPEYLPMRVCFWCPPCMNRGGRWEAILVEEKLCFGAYPVWIRGGERRRRLCHVWVKLQTYPYQTYRNRADRLCMAGIGSSNFHIADFGLGRLLRLSPLRSNFAGCTFTVPTQFESRLYSTTFFQAGSILNWNYILYIHHFFIYTFKSTTKNSAPLYV